MTAPSPALSHDVIARIPLTAGWEVASTKERTEPGNLDNLHFVPAQVPGTAASALRAQQAWRVGGGIRFDAAEHWFRCKFEAKAAAPGEEIILQLGGIATVAEVWLNGQSILTSESMFISHELNVSTLVRGCNELLIVCRPLSDALRERRGRQPQARWRTRVISEQQLRWLRTTLLGRAPGFAGEPEPVGPWRPVTLLRRRRAVLENWSRQAELDGTTGVIRAQFQLRSLENSARPVSGRLRAGDVSVPLEWKELDDQFQARATLRIPSPARWFPHTHGEPALYPLRAEVTLADGSSLTFEDTPVGFRSIDFGSGLSGDGEVALQVNGVMVFCRGVVWAPPDVVSLAAPDDVVRERLQLLRDAGLNMIRLAGTTVYETESFHRICDELGLLVWQDMMFSNMDYPFADAGFRQTACAEAQAELSRVGRNSSTAMICGNSEIEQQVGMLGLDSALGRDDFFGEELPRIAAACCPGVPYIPSAPCGGDQPFRTRSGVTNYFGVGGYMRPLDDVRRAEVRFASECLAFSNVPEPEMVEKLALATPGGISPLHPAWKRGVPRDAGAGWDFEDVRDHYLKLLYSVDPLALRYSDAARYWELSRMVSGEVMAEVFGEWRRPASPCGGGIVLWSADLEPGAGWGILDSQGSPKAVYWFLRRALAARSVWTSDEGLNGVDIHVANDCPIPMDARLRVALYRRYEQRIAESEITITVPENRTLTFGLEKILGRFIDASYAYRFGPPGHDLIAVSLHAGLDDVPFAQSFRFPTGRVSDRIPIDNLEIAGACEVLVDGSIQVSLTARRFAYGVRLSAQGFRSDDAYFGIEPGGGRRIVLKPVAGAETPGRIAVTAINAEGRITIPIGSAG